MYVHTMPETTPPRTGLLIPDAAALVGVPELDIRQAIAADDLPHSYRLVVDKSDVQAWAQGRAEQ